MKELENYINALDYTTPPNSRPGGINYEEKAKGIENNKRLFHELHNKIQPIQKLKTEYWEKKMKSY